VEAGDLTSRLKEDDSLPDEGELASKERAKWHVGAVGEDQASYVPRQEAQTQSLHPQDDSVCGAKIDLYRLALLRGSISLSRGCLLLDYSLEVLRQAADVLVSEGRIMSEVNASALPYTYRPC